MSPPHARWSRPFYERSDRKAVDFRVIWLEEPIERPEFNGTKHGFPSGSLDDLNLIKIEDPQWLRNWTEEPWGWSLDRIPGIDLPRLRSCRHGVIVRSECEDPLEMTLVQIGAAVGKAYADLGALAVLDVIGDRWWSPPKLKSLPADRPFDIEEHITVTGETDERRPGAGHLCHTRGMRKFARPELFLRGIPAQDFNGATRLFNDVGERMALGKNYGSRSVVILHPDDETEFPPITFLPHADDSDGSKPAHGLGERMFNSPTLEVVDFDDEAGVPSGGAERILEAIRGYRPEDSSE